MFVGRNCVLCVCCVYKNITRTLDTVWAMCVLRIALHRTHTHHLRINDDDPNPHSIKLLMFIVVAFIIIIIIMDGMGCIHML